VPAGRADLLANALKELITSSEERDAMIKAGRARVEEFHDVSRAAQQLFELLDGVREL
jgi:glycosyltransferase involved in cell wall biosynthesis